MRERTDIAVAQSLMWQTFGYRHDIASLEQLIPQNEEVRRIAGGECDGDSGLLVLTDQRLCFVSRGYTRWAVTRSEITQARCDCGELFGTVSVVTSRGDFRVRQVARADSAGLTEAAGGRCRRAYRMPDTRTG